jgi:uncharacterized membrane protein YedE/YeeE
MKFIKFLIVGIVFGIVLSKAEIISWYRIYEMFRFESFHMYGVIGSAIIIGIIGIKLITIFNVKNIEGNKVSIPDKDKGYIRYSVGGLIFGVGWALTGACPGPIFILLGHGLLSVGVLLVGATFGAFVYGVFKSKLPH